MAEKNWLIRTKNKQILGPATKQKVIELIEKGSLTPDDEVTCGNGYWFWIRERDLIDKYLYGDMPQEFNPISEAEDVLTAKNTPDGITASVTESPSPPVSSPEPSPADNLIPSEDDLAYPDEEDLDYPDVGDSPSPTPEPEPGPELEQEPVTPDATGEVELDFNQNSTAEVEVKAAPVVENTQADGKQAYTEDGENFLFPSAFDLEYPEVPGMEPIVEETQEQEPEPEVAAKEAPEEFDDVTDPNMEIPGVDSPVEGEEEPIEEIIPNQQEDEHGDAQDFEEDEEPVKPPPKKKKKKKTKKKKRKLVTERKGNDRYLFIIIFLIIAAIGVIFYYYKEVLNKPFPVIGIHEANAQTLQSLSKKKSF